MKTPAEEPAILLVDDEEELLFSTRLILRREGFANVLTQSDSRLVAAMLDEQPVAVLVLDMTMPHLSGLDLLRRVKETHPGLPVVMMTAVNDVDTAVACMQAGADNYLVKPVDRTRLVATVGTCYDLGRTRTELDRLRRHLSEGQLENEAVFRDIITVSPRMRSIFFYLESVAPSRQPVLITGETGTGKELVARVIHTLSGGGGPFVAVNLAGLDDTMFSDTLFGHQRGAFTGADRAREGLVCRAEAGTLFLDEIGDLSPSSQVKLLRLLQEGEYLPLGADTPRICEARIVVATHVDLKAGMESGRFRSDLYYRLCAHHVALPPLRERPEDIPLLLEHFLDNAAQALNKARPSAPPELSRYLAAYRFPGNIRELEALVRDAVARHPGHGILSLEPFLVAISGDLALPQDEASNEERCHTCLFKDRFPTLKGAEEYLIAEALRLAGGNQRLAASYLGITRQALNKRLSRAPA
ncbi:sigma-54-dependent Fis family transcriptional regulator [Oryzomonas japonica]|uniref:Sigma-54-dependent Fis family transcriptional regulator n=1 Tax=Oryzomonas japonica TaxID=2603858 RepID=A0A7J4ZT76_9BACT|nr:sigma-54 dependent transcriptional regulator [Oryzomonas japonica]KAB0666281.1 sigma-54-dependent Fis family transcriptional regulator [Oryzomonas japonica]